MRILLLSGGGRLTPEAIIEVGSALGEAGVDVELAVASWHPPARPLPVAQHLVVGPHASWGRGTTKVTTAPPRPVAPPAPGTVVDDPGVPDAAPPETIPGAELPAADAGSVIGLPRPTPSFAAPRLGPARVRAAVGWRWRRLRRHPLLRRARRAILPSSSLAFALNSTRQPAVLEAAGAADLLIALDTPAQQAAWAIARRVPGPAVVAGVVAARRLLVDGPALHQT